MWSYPGRVVVLFSVWCFGILGPFVPVWEGIFLWCHGSRACVVGAFCALSVLVCFLCPAVVNAIVVSL